MPRERALIVVAAAAALLAMGSSACTPCDGVIGCTVSPQLSLSGEFVSRDVVQAPAVPGVRVDVVSRSPDLLVDSVASATSDANGWWTVALRARGYGSATVDVVVTPPAPDPPYRVTGLVFETSGLRGQGSETGRWVPRPYISYLGVLTDAATNTPIVGAQVRVVRRGGITVAPTAATDSVMHTDGSGRFLYDVKPSALAPLYVTFLVDRAGLPTASIPTTVMPGYEYTPVRAYATTTFTVDSAGHVSGAGVSATAAR